MNATLDDVTKKSKRELPAEQNQELTEHLDHDKHAVAGSEAGNVRNGTRPKTVLTEASGQVGIDVPRDRARDVRAADRQEAAATAGRVRPDRAVAVCQGPDHGRDQPALRRDLRRLDIE
jgi:transposase-like protein